MIDRWSIVVVAHNHRLHTDSRYADIVLYSWANADGGTNCRLKFRSLTLYFGSWFRWIDPRWVWRSNWLNLQWMWFMERFISWRVKCYYKLYNLLSLIRIWTENIRLIDGRYFFYFPMILLNYLNVKDSLKR